MTGMHTVADIACVGCSTVLGWKYVRPGPTLPAGRPNALPALLTAAGLHVQEAAVEESQKYKEGKFILEKAKIMKVGLGWPGAACLLFTLTGCQGWLSWAMHGMASWCGLPGGSTPRQLD